MRNITILLILSIFSACALAGQIKLVYNKSDANSTVIGYLNQNNKFVKVTPLGAFMKVKNRSGKTLGYISITKQQQQEIETKKRLKSIQQAREMLIKKSQEFQDTYNQAMNQLDKEEQAILSKN